MTGAAANPSSSVSATLTIPAKTLLPSSPLRTSPSCAMAPPTAVTATSSAPPLGPSPHFLGPAGIGMPMHMSMSAPMLTPSMPAHSQYMPFATSPPQASPALGPLAPARAASFDVGPPSSSGPTCVPRNAWPTAGMAPLVGASAVSSPPPSGQHQLFMPPASMQSPVSAMPAFPHPDAPPLPGQAHVIQPLLAPLPPRPSREPQGALVGARLNWCDMICQTIAELADPHMVVQDLFLRMCYLFPEIGEWAVGKDWEVRTRRFLVPLILISFCFQGKVKNRIKSTLSIKNAVFSKVPRPSHVQGKGAWWTLTPEVLAEWRTGKKAEAVRSMPTHVDIAPRRRATSSTVDAASTGGAKRNRKTRHSGAPRTIDVSRESSLQASSQIVNTPSSVSLPPQGLGFSTGVPGYKAFMAPMSTSPLMTEAASLPPSVNPSPVVSSTTLDTSSPTVLDLQFGSQPVPSSLSSTTQLSFMAANQHGTAFNPSLPSLAASWSPAASKVDTYLTQRPSGSL